MLLMDGVRLLKLTSICGPNNTNLGKEFLLELLGLFGLTNPNMRMSGSEDNFNVTKRV